MKHAAVVLVLLAVAGFSQVTNYPGGGGGGSLTANGSGTVTDLSSTTPAAEAGYVLGKVQAGSGHASMEVKGSDILSLVFPAVAANLVYASGTSGGSASPTFRALVAADLPNPPVTIYTLATLYSGTYTSGITTTCSAGQYCALTFSDGATGRLACAGGGNSITASTAITNIVAGTGLDAPPTTATVGNGTATSCTGTVVLATVISVSPTGSGFFKFNLTGPTTALLPTASAGLQQCFRQSAGKSGAITLRAPASTYIDLLGVNGSAAGLLASSGFSGDAVCLVGIDATHFDAYTSAGAWAAGS